MELMEKTLKERWADLLKEQPKMRIRNAAELLGATELELLATRDSAEVIFLKPAFIDILKGVGSIGRVMALTRNDSVVHEVKGEYDRPEFNGPMVGMFLGEWIDLRIFFSVWKYALAVSEGDRKSLQFFDKSGNAIHKIYLTDQSNDSAYHELVNAYTSNDRSVSLEEVADAPVFSNPESIDRYAFQQGWLEMKDTHEFFGLVKKYNLSRQDALRNAPEGEFAISVKPEAVAAMLKACSDRKVPIMSFVGNHGMIQIFSGEVNRIIEMDEWLNVMDPRFNLHIKSASLVDVWVVRKPSVDGIVTSVECFDSKRELIVQFFGKRKPGIPELEGWRDIVRNIQDAYKV